MIIVLLHCVLHTREIPELLQPFLICSWSIQVGYRYPTRSKMESAVSIVAVVELCFKYVYYVYTYDIIVAIA